MHNVILQFIEKRFPDDSNWKNGNCLWFAQILKDRFPGGKIYYLPAEGHFVYYYKGVFYDHGGVVELSTSEGIPFDKIKEEDKLWYARLIRECFN